LKSAAYIRASAGGVSRSCDLLRAGRPENLPWICTLLIVGKDGHLQCSANNIFVGLDLSDRTYLKKARESRELFVSDFLFAGMTNRPVAMAAHPGSAINDEADSVILAAVNLDWMSKIMSNLGGRPGISAGLVDSAGTVLAAPANQASLIGPRLDALPLLSAMAETALDWDQPQGSLWFVAADGSTRAVS